MKLMIGAVKGVLQAIMGWFRLSYVMMAGLVVVGAGIGVVATTAINNRPDSSQDNVGSEVAYVETGDVEEDSGVAPSEMQEDEGVGESYGDETIHQPSIAPLPQPQSVRQSPQPAPTQNPSPPIQQPQPQLGWDGHMYRQLNHGEWVNECGWICSSGRTCFGPWFMLIDWARTNACRQYFHGSPTACTESWLACVDSWKNNPNAPYTRCNHRR